MPRVMPEYKEEVRKKILNAAHEIAEEQGLSNIRMEDIAGRVGISRATLYLYFRNREELIAEGNKAFCKNVSGILTETLGKDGNKDVFLAMFDDFVFPENEYGTKAVVEMFVEAIKDEKMRDIIGGSYYSMKSMISDFLREEKKNGKIDEGVDPDLAAGILQSIALGMKVGSVVGLERDEAREIWKNAIEKLILK